MGISKLALGKKRTLKRRKKLALKRRNRKHALKYPQINAPARTIDNQTDFSLSLAGHVISTEAKDKNFVFSPASVHVVLCMVAAGSEGPTRDQILGYLKSKSVEELNLLSSQIGMVLLADRGPLGGPRLSSANGVWIDRSLVLKPTFKEIVENVYGAACDHVDFQNKADEVRKEVNAWAYKKTNGLIKDILPSGSVDPTTILILANALYFKGSWNEKFDAFITRDRDFFLPNGSSVRVPFMSRYYKKQYVRAFDGFKVLSLPYRQGRDEHKFSMHVFLPDARDGLPPLVEKVCSKSGFIDRHLPFERVNVGDFRIPKFKIDFGFEASEVLKGHGLVLPFSPGGMAGMVEDTGADGDLFVSGLFHKSCIEVDEQGTEAAAASSVVHRITGCRVEKGVDFVADHPFMFVVREDRSGVVLFVGQVVNPLSAG